MDKDNINFFARYLTEAPEDEPPTEEPPSLPDDSNDPPPMDDNAGFDDGANNDFSDEPPGFDDAMDETNFDDNSQNGEENKENKIEGIDNKVSAILNTQLYQRFLRMVSDIGNQLSLLKNNKDILNSLNKEINRVEDKYIKLDENIRLYLRYNFINENYSKNLLFFNKCLNLLSLLNNSFEHLINSGIRNNR